MSQKPAVSRFGTRPLWILAWCLYATRSRRQDCVVLDRGGATMAFSQKSAFGHLLDQPVLALSAAERPAATDARDRYWQDLLCILKESTGVQVSLALKSQGNRSVCLPQRSSSCRILKFRVRYAGGIFGNRQTRLASSHVAQVAKWYRMASRAALRARSGPRDVHSGDRFGGR